MLSNYNRKVATTTYPCPIQPPYRRNRMMEPLSHYHCEIYCCKPVLINLHQTTYNQHVPKQPAINLYHQKVHQPCTKYVPIMHQILIKYDSSICTHQLYTSCMCQLINYLSQPCTQHVPQPKSLINFIIQI
jgi:hypothetical protein